MMIALPWPRGYRGPAETQRSSGPAVDVQRQHCFDDCRVLVFRIVGDRAGKGTDIDGVVLEQGESGPHVVPPNSRQIALKINNRIVLRVRIDSLECFEDTVRA